MGASQIAELFQKFGGLLGGLSLALFALGTVSVMLLRAKNNEIARSNAQVDQLTALTVSLTEKRIADRDAFQTKLDALAREVNETMSEVTRSIFALTRAVEEARPRRRSSTPSSLPMAEEPTPAHGTAVRKEGT